MYLKLLNNHSVILFYLCFMFLLYVIALSESKLSWRNGSCSLLLLKTLSEFKSLIYLNGNLACCKWIFLCCFIVAEIWSELKLLLPELKFDLCIWRQDHTSGNVLGLFERAMSKINIRAIALYKTYELFFAALLLLNSRWVKAVAILELQLGLR